MDKEIECLNAPYGAPCFLTGSSMKSAGRSTPCLNAPYGAPCFLTGRTARFIGSEGLFVLMHLMALRAF